MGVIGAGAFGREHARAYSRIPDARLVSIEDVDPDRARALAEEFGATKGEPPAAVSVVVPVGSRGSLVPDLIARGAAVLVEKPLASSGPAARSLAALAEGRAVMVGHVLRFAQPYVELERRVRGWGPLGGGSLGRVRSAAHAARHPSDDVVGLTMIHDLDAAPWLAGAPVATVSAEGARGVDGRWVSCDAQLTTTDGSRWFVHARWDGDDADQRDDATVTAADGRSASISLGAADAGVYDDALEAELAHFIAHARSGTSSPRLVVADAARAVEVADAVRRSLEQAGATIDVH